jgi:hypothetical protein
MKTLLERFRELPDYWKCKQLKQMTTWIWFNREVARSIFKKYKDKSL